MEGDVAEDGEGAAVVASTLRHRECSVTVVIALFLQILWRLFRIFFSSFLLKNTIETLSLSIHCLTGTGKNTWTGNTTDGEYLNLDGTLRHDVTWTGNALDCFST